MNEYFIRIGKSIINQNEAIGRYNAGLRNPQIYRYHTGQVINNTSILPY